MCSCKVTYEKPLLTKVSIENSPKQVDKSELYSLVKQKPNKNILFFFPFHRKIYELGEKLPDRSHIKAQRINKKIENYTQKGKKFDIRKLEEKKQRSFRNWLMNVVGEKPAILDTIQASISKKQMQLFLQNKGYFNAKVETQYKYQKNNKKSHLKFLINAGSFYTINHYDIYTSDDRLISLLNQIKNKSLINVGMQYDTELLDAERERIVSFLRNIGFYYFSKSFLYFEADSSSGNNSIELKLFIRPFVVQDNQQSIITSHPRYIVGNVWFYPNFSFTRANSIQNDTIKVMTTYQLADSMPLNYYFVYTKKFPIKTKRLIQNCHIIPSQFVSIQKANQTITSLSSLGMYKYVNIRFDETEITHKGFKILDAHIELIPTKKQSIQIEAESSHSSGSMGTAAGLIYKNKNLFKGSELFSLGLRSALELQLPMFRSDTIEQTELVRGLPFNSYELGIEASIIIPAFLMPYSTRFFTVRNKPLTNIQGGFFYQHRPDLDRQIINFQYEYQWFETSEKFHQLTPIFINVLKINPDSSFLLVLQQFSRQIQSSYKDHFISGTRWSYISRKQTSSSNKPLSVLRINAETAGNFARLYAIVFGGAKPSETYYFMNIRFAQYAKLDMEYKRYWPNLRNNSNNVFRFFWGIAFPYGNIDVMPFEKRFSASGSNDIRAWKFRSLGPGSYRDDNNFDKTGDIALIMNFENRFPLYKVFQGALFADIGNVWMLRDYPDYPDGVFRFDTFYKQLAIGIGFGLRLDFGFFIIRADGAIPIRDPAYKWNASRFLPLSEALSKTNINFGIGYPF